MIFKDFLGSVFNTFGWAIQSGFFGFPISAMLLRCPHKACCQAKCLVQFFSSPSLTAKQSEWTQKLHLMSHSERERFIFNVLRKMRVHEDCSQRNRQIFLEPDSV